MSLRMTHQHTAEIALNGRIAYKKTRKKRKEKGLRFLPNSQLWFCFTVCVNSVLMEEMTPRWCLRGFSADALQVCHVPAVTSEWRWRKECWMDDCGEAKSLTSGERVAEGRKWES